MLLVPYISPQEFADTFVDIDLSKYVPSGTSPSASNSLINLLRRASAIADQWCKQLLRATVDTETVLMYPTKNRSLRVWPKYRPLVSLTSLQYTYDPQMGWTTVSDLSPTGGLQTYESYFDYSGDSSLCQLYKLTVQYSYVNGFPVVNVSGTVAQSASTIQTQQTPIGVSSGMVLTLYDGVNSEDVTVQSVSGNTITLVSPTQHAHTSSNTVYTLSAVPDAIRTATGIIASNMITRGMDGAMSTKDKDFELAYRSDSVVTADAETLLKPYQVNR